MKILLDKYPKGTYKGQVSDGKYIDGYLYSNLKLMAKKIVDDMTFLGIIYSSTLEVGTGKSVLGTQIGEAWSEAMREVHGIEIPWGIKNIVWRPKELIERSFQVPKYSYILLDEWEDATYWSELGMTLRQFFRKCRQLNLFIMCIIPNWFQMNMGYAISRSAFAIDVKFGDGFTRGNFSFYGFESKRRLYIKGKKEHNYYVSSPDFSGRFINGYGVDEAEYRIAKRKDLEKWEDPKEKPLNEEDIKRKIVKEILDNSEKITQKDIAKAFGLTQQAVSNWINKEKEKEKGDCSSTNTIEQDYTLNPIDKKIDWSEGEVLTEEEQKKRDENQSLY